jgi:hypothetical protein
MFVDKNILAGAIAEGKDPESIAQEMIAALNEAIIMNREAEEAKKAAEAERAQLESAGILLAAFTSYIADYCPNMLDMMENEEDDLEPEDIVEIMAMMDEGFVKSKEWVDKMAQGVNDLLQMFIPKEVETAGGPDLQPLQVEPGTTPKMPVSISDFLKANGL